jgi:hydroxyacylglutathione hydrolase
MPLEIVTVPCLSDNYAYLIHDPPPGPTALVDVPEAAPIRRRWRRAAGRLSDILITHHHADHVDGVEAAPPIRRKVWGRRPMRTACPPLDHAWPRATAVRSAARRGTVIDVSGHTVGHIAFHFPERGAVFTADSLMALGCGRLFEGTMPQMWASLSKAGRPAARDAGLFGPRIHRRQRALRADDRTRTTRA